MIGSLLTITARDALNTCLQMGKRRPEALVRLGGMNHRVEDVVL
jgi:hypothetical protein